MSKNNRILTTAVCIFLSLVLAVGAGFGIYFAILEANTLVKNENVRMDEGTVRVFASYYKKLHLNTLKSAGYSNASDTQSFWQSLHENGKTQAEVYRESLDSYISGIAAAANLYLTSYKLTDDDKAFIKSKTEAFISYYGSEDEFNKLTEKFGFDYDDFCRAMELSYTANVAYGSLYGSRGEALKSSKYASRLEDYLSKYVRVKLIFISTDLVYDEELKEYRDQNPSEQFVRNEAINRLKSAIEEGRVVEVTFDEYLSDKDNPNDGNTEYGLVGYYFARGAEETERYEYPEIVDAALGMGINEAKVVETEDGYAFLYRCEPVSGAYNMDEVPGLSDFYENAAFEFFNEDIELVSGEVILKEKYRELDFLSIPANDRIFVTEWK